MLIVCFIIFSLNSPIESKKPNPNNVTLSNAQLQDLVSMLWDADVNRAKPEQILLNYQNFTDPHNKIDRAPEKLFLYVDKNLLSLPTIDCLISLFESYKLDSRKQDSATSDRREKIDRFLSEILNTKVMKLLQYYLKNYGYNQASSDEQFRRALLNLWFDGYSRYKNISESSSGFEHVFIGEVKKGKVSGMHSWIRMYWLENRNEFDYMGLITEVDYIATIQFKWKKYWKPIGGMFVGTSPEFDFALYTLCFLSKYGSKCKFMVGDCISVKITTYDKVENEQRFIATAYPSMAKSADNCTIKNSSSNSELFISTPSNTSPDYLNDEFENLVHNSSFILFPSIVNFLAIIMFLLVESGF